MKEPRKNLDSVECESFRIRLIDDIKTSFYNELLLAEENEMRMNEKEMTIKKFVEGQIFLIEFNL